MKITEFNKFFFLYFSVLQWKNRINQNIEQLTKLVKKISLLCLSNEKKKEEWNYVDSWKNINELFYLDMGLKIWLNMDRKYINRKQLLKT